MVAASVPTVSRAAIVVIATKPAIQSRMRPTGYHSRSGAAGEAPSPHEASLFAGRANEARGPSHQAGSATVMAKAIQKGSPKIAPIPAAPAVPPKVAQSGPHPNAATITG